jgi:Zn-finger domain-containing protein
MPTRSIFYRRKFLNRPRHHLGAHVIATIELRTDGHGAPNVDASLRIADCVRNILLDFDVYTPSQGRNAVRKARILRDILTEYVDALERAVDEWEDVRENNRNEPGTPL